MWDDEPVTLWLRQLEAGDGDAARRLWQRYYRELVELARVRLGTTPRRAFDEEDVALSVMRCLCDGAVRGQFKTLVNRRELWLLLATITGRKVVDQQRRLNKKKRGRGKVRGDSVLRRSSALRPEVGFDQLQGDAPPPEVLAIAAEEYQRLLGLLTGNHLRQIAEWKLEGNTNECIAKRLGLACRSIERKLQIIRRIWAAELTP
jgi:hypothetical protein